MLLTLFPEERPEYARGVPAGDRMEIRLHRAAKMTTASCLLYRDGVFRGFARMNKPDAADTLGRERAEQRLIKKQDIRIRKKAYAEVKLLLHAL